MKFLVKFFLLFFVTTFSSYAIELDINSIKQTVEKIKNEHKNMPLEQNDVNKNNDLLENNKNQEELPDSSQLDKNLSFDELRNNLIAECKERFGSLKPISEFVPGYVPRQPGQTSRSVKDINASLDLVKLYQHKEVIAQKIDAGVKQINSLSESPIGKSATPCVVNATNFYKAISANDYKILNEAFQNINNSTSSIIACSKTKLDRISGISKLDIHGVRIDACLQDIPLNVCNDWKLKNILDFKNKAHSDNKIIMDNEFYKIAEEVSKNYPRYYLGKPFSIAVPEPVFRAELDSMRKEWERLSISQTHKSAYVSSLSCGNAFHIALSPSGKIAEIQKLQNIDNKVNANGDILETVLKDFGVSDAVVKKMGNCSKSDFAKQCSVSGKFENKIGFSVDIFNRLDAGWLIRIALFDVSVDLAKEFKEISESQRKVKNDLRY